MTYYRFPENRVTKILAFAAMFLLLVFCRDTYITHWVVNLEISTAITMGVVCLTGTAFLICNRRNLKAVFTDRRMLLLAVAQNALCFGVAMLLGLTPSVRILYSLLALLPVL